MIGCISMASGVPNKRYASQFKQMAARTIQRERLSDESNDDTAITYRESARYPAANKAAAAGTIRLSLWCHP